MRDSFMPHHKKSLTVEEQKKMCEAVNSTKEKSHGETKGGTCANGSNQQGHISKEEAASPTISTELVLTMGVMEAKQGCKVCTSNIPNAFIQTKLDEIKERIVLVLCAQHQKTANQKAVERWSGTST